MQLNDATRAALMAAVQSLLNVLVLLGLVHITSETLAGIMLAISNAVVFLGLIIKSGQQPGPTPVDPPTTIK